jgi:hypothetical protein
MATESKSTTSPSGGQRKKASTSKTSAGKKTSPAKARSSSSSAQTSRSESRQGAGSGSGTGTGRRAGKMNALAVARSAAQQLAELTGRAPESVIGIERSEDGWTVELEVVESRRIPDSTDILATYRVEVDEDGDLQGYHRVERYVRGKSARSDSGR